jgi:hypothetical protein
MYDRMKGFLLKALNAVVALLMLSLATIYAAISGVLATMVINDLRLDAYIGAETGIAMVLLLIMLGYIPLYWVIRAARD